jgi:SnoaL-like domain
MSPENVEVFCKSADALNSGGVAALLEFCPEDVVWYPFPNAPESPDGFHGHDGLREVVGGWTDSFDEFTVAVGESRERRG